MVKNKICMIHFIKAMSGDCLLLELQNKKCILIDCGYKTTYRKELKPLLLDLAKRGYVIALFVVTHMDEDHIGGAVEFIEDNGDCRMPNIIAIEHIWFNCLWDICQQNNNIMSHLVSSVTEKERVKNQKVCSDLLKLISDSDGYISATHAELFEILCRKNNYQMNLSGQNGLIIAGTSMQIDTCKVSILSPGINEINLFSKWIERNLIECFGRQYRLEKERFLDYLEKVVLVRGRDGNGTAVTEPISAGYCTIEDWMGTSTLAAMNEANRVSIVLEIECEGRRLLFCGDSESGDWIDKAKKNYDYVKLSHHGSTKPNLCLLEKVDFKKALISTNGKRNHPENELLARLIKKKMEAIFFNYNIKEKKEIEFLQEKYGFEAHFEEQTIDVY